MPRYVILTHDHPKLHWDFMLEWGGALRTWRLMQELSLGDIPAEPLPDHRIAYLDYEGPISGNRGTVTRWDSGDYEALQGVPLRIRLTGTRIQAVAELHVKPDETIWRFLPLESAAHQE